MIKIQIHSLEGACDIEIKKQQEYYHLVVIMSKSHVLNEKGKAWYGKTPEEKSIQEITDLINSSYQNPSVPNSISINDGIQITFNLKENGQEINLVCKDIEKGTQEFQLIHKTMALVNDLIKDPVLNSYTKIVESYTNH